MKSSALFLIILFSQTALATEIGWPLTQFSVNQEFGARKESKHYSKMGHWGIDITEGPGAVVRPIAEGRVVAVGTETCINQPNPDCNYGNGNWVLIDHPSLQIQSFYGHLSAKSTLQPGQIVSRSSTIGYEGRSGYLFDLESDQIAPLNCPTHLHLTIGELKSYETVDKIVDIQIGQLLDPRDLLPPISDSK